MGHFNFSELSLVPDISLFCYHRVKTIRYVQPYHKHVLFCETSALVCMHLKMQMPLKLIGRKQRMKDISLFLNNCGRHL